MSLTVTRTSGVTAASSEAKVEEKDPVVTSTAPTTAVATETVQDDPEYKTKGKIGVASGHVSFGGGKSINSPLDFSDRGFLSIGGMVEGRLQVPSGPLFGLGFGGKIGVVYSFAGKSSRMIGEREQYKMDQSSDGPNWFQYKEKWGQIPGLQLVDFASGFVTLPQVSGLQFRVGINFGYASESSKEEVREKIFEKKLRENNAGTGLEWREDEISNRVIEKGTGPERSGPYGNYVVGFTYEIPNTNGVFVGAEGYKTAFGKETAYGKFESMGARANIGIHF